MKWKPKPYQKKGAKWLVERTAAALFFDPGLGKTSSTLAALMTLFKTGQIRRALVVAPLNVCYEVWPAEIAKWDEFSHLRWVILHGDDKERARLQDADIYLINPEGLQWLVDAKVTEVRKKKVVKVDMKRWLAYNFDVIVIDELSKFKHPSSIRYKVLREIHRTFKRRWGLTGTPAANGLMDLFGQMYVIDCGASFGPYITHFRKAFCDRGHDGFSYTIREGAAEKIYQKIAPVALRMEGSDYLDLPERVDVEINVTLPPKALELYREMDVERIVKVSEGIVTAATAAVVSGKCRQIASGGLYVGDETGDLKKRKTSFVHDAKTDALEGIVDELQGSPLLVLYEWDHDVDRILKRFPGTPILGGGTPQSVVKDTLRMWNMGALPILVGHPASIGYGLNMQGGGCGHVCWYSLTWNLELYEQTIKRIHRQGNVVDRVIVYHILARGTDDHRVKQALINKQNVQAELFRYLEEQQRSRRTNDNSTAPARRSRRKA